MAIFSILNKLIELGEEVVYSLDKDLYPKTYLEVPKILFDNKIITKKQYGIFKSFIEYRNEIAHEYDDITKEEIFWCINNLSIIKEFMKIVKKYLLE